MPVSLPPNECPDDLTPAVQLELGRQRTPTRYIDATGRCAIGWRIEQSIQLLSGAVVTRVTIADANMVLLVPPPVEISEFDIRCTTPGAFDPCVLFKNLPAGDAITLIGLDVDKNCINYTLPDLLALNTPLVVVDTNTVNFSNSGPDGHTIQADVRISAAAGNDLVANGDGLFVNAPALVVIDTPTVDLTNGGVDGHTVQADVRISSRAGNTLLADAIGLYVSAQAETPLQAVDSSTVDFTTSGVAQHTITGAVRVSTRVGNLITVIGDGLFSGVQPETPLQAVDSSTIDFATAGPDQHTLTAVVKVSSAPGNIVVVNADGIFVPTTAETALVATDSGSIDFTTSGTAGHALTGVVKLSATAGNIATLNADGVYVPTSAETALVATDSSTVDFTTSGTAGHALTGAVKVSATAGNTITVNADGLFATGGGVETALVATDSTSIDFTTSGTAGHALTGVVKISTTAGNVLQIDATGLLVPSAAAGVQTPISVVDTNSINLTASGTDSHTLQADVIIDPLASNRLSVSAAGLLVAKQAETPLTATDTATIDLTTSGVSQHTLTADVKISATAGNVLTANADGLFVGAAAAGAQTPITVTDSTSVDLTASGTDNHALTATVKISTTAGNVLQVDATGLLVPAAAAGAQTPITVTDSSTVDLSASGTDSHALTAAVKISATAGNTLVANADGLFAPGGAGAGTETSITVVDSTTVNLTSDGTAGHNLTADVKISTALNNGLTVNATGLMVAPCQDAKVVAAGAAASVVWAGATISLPTICTGVAPAADVTFAHLSSGFAGQGHTTQGGPTGAVSSAVVSVLAGDILVFSINVSEHFLPDITTGDLTVALSAALAASITAFTEISTQDAYSFGFASMRLRTFMGRAATAATGTVDLNFTYTPFYAAGNGQASWEILAVRNASLTATFPAAQSSTAVDTATAAVCFAAPGATSSGLWLVGTRHTACTPDGGVTVTTGTSIDVMNPDAPNGRCADANCNIGAAAAGTAINGQLCIKTTDNNGAFPTNREAVQGFTFTPIPGGGAAGGSVDHVNTSVSVTAPCPPCPDTAVTYAVMGSFDGMIMEGDLGIGARYKISAYLNGTKVSSKKLVNQGTAVLPYTETLPAVNFPLTSIAACASKTMTVRVVIECLNHVAGSTLQLFAGSATLTARS